MRIPVQRPYDFEMLLRFLSRWSTPVLDIAEGGGYRRVFSLSGGPVLVEVRQAEESTAELAVSVLRTGGRIDSAELQRRITHVLGADEPLEPFWRWARSHAELWPVLSAVEGLPLPRTETLFEGLLCAVIEQQIAWTAAQRAQRTLCEWGGAGLEYEGRTYYAMPAPERLAVATPSELKALKITDRRVGVLIGIAGDIVSGRFDPDALAGLPHAERCAALMRIKGVGQWTSVVALSRAFGTAPEVASNDVALRAAVKRYLPDYAADADPVGAAFGGCGEYAGLAATYLLSRYVLDKY